MKRFKLTGAQGDLLLIKTDKVPKGLKELSQLDSQGNYIVAHSETGHHHTVSAKAVKVWIATQMLMYMEVKKAVELKHHRAFDRHDTLIVPPGMWEIRRQREYTPEGWRRVED